MPSRPIESLIPETQATRVLLVDDYEPWRRQLKVLLADDPRWTIVGEAANGADAVSQAKALDPDLILLDVTLPKLTGTLAAERILSDRPGSRILMVSESRCWDQIELSLTTGARGYVVKSEAPRQLPHAMAAVMRGERFLSPTLGGRSLAERAAPHDSSRGCHEGWFYDDNDLAKSWATAVEAALRRGAAVILACSIHQRSLVEQILQDRGIEIDAEASRGRYTFVESRDVLSRTMIDAWPDERSFWKVAIPVVMRGAKASAAVQPRVTVCGACAPLLWVENGPAPAIRLEELWDQLSRAFDIETFCGYPKQLHDAQDSDFKRVCEEHSATVTTR